MIGSLLRLVKVDIEQQVARLKWEAEGLKDRTIGDAKAAIISTGITVGLVLSGLFLVLLTLIVGLIALYVWVEDAKGPLVALGAVGGTTAILAVLLFGVAATRGSGQAPRRPAPPPPLLKPALPTAAELRTSVIEGTTAAAEALFNKGAESLRTSSRPALLGTIAVAAIVGIFVGRRR